LDQLPQNSTSFFFFIRSSLELATRLASSVTDQTTVERLRTWIEDLKQKLQHRLEARRIKQEITLRAREIWEQNGRPSGQDLVLASSRKRDQGARSAVTALLGMPESLNFSI
jgi:hypothetical protein